MPLYQSRSTTVRLPQSPSARRRRLALTVLVGFALAAALTLWLAAVVRWLAALLMVTALGLFRLGALEGRVFGAVATTGATVLAVALGVALARGLRALAIRARGGRPPPLLALPVSLVLTTLAALAAAGALVGEVSQAAAAGVLLGAAGWLALAGPVLLLRSGFRVAGRSLSWGSWSGTHAGLVGLAAGLVVAGAAWANAWTLDGLAAGLRIGAWVASPAQGPSEDVSLRGILRRIAIVGERGLTPSDPTRREPLLVRLDRASSTPPVPPPRHAPLSEGEMVTRVGRLRHHRFEDCVAQLHALDEGLYEDARTWLVDSLGGAEASEDILFESVLRVCLQVADDPGADPRGLFLEAVANSRADRAEVPAGFPGCEGLPAQVGCWQAEDRRDLPRPEDRTLVRWAFCQAPAEARRALRLHLEEGRSFEDLALRMGRDTSSATSLYYRGLDVIRSRWEEAACGESTSR